MGLPVHRRREEAPPVTEAALVTIDEVRAAAANLAGVVLRTPLVPFLAGPPRVLLKAESLQPIGAFKIRGAYHAITSLSPAERARGFVSHSSGNHAQGVARAAKLLGVRATIVMPSDAPAVKRRRVEADGAEIVTVGPASGEREAMAERLADERGLVPIPPYDDDRIIAGQGTVGLEISEDVPDLAAVVVPIGGGGLASGTAVAVRALRPGARIIGVEPELAADARESLAAGEVVHWDASLTTRTMADGLRVEHLGRLPFIHLRRFMDEVVTVSEGQMRDAIRQLARGARLVVEPSGAAAMAAHLFGAAPQPDGDDRRVVVISGGNIDPAMLAEFLAPA